MPPAVNPMFAKFDQALGKTTPTVAGAPQSTRAQEILALGQQTTPTDNVATETGKNYMANVDPAAQDVMGKGNIGAAADNFAKGNILGGIEKSTLGVGADAIQAIFAPLAAPLKTLLDHTAKANAANPSSNAGENVTSSPQADLARASIANWARAHPDISQTLSDALTVGTGVLGGEAGIMSKPVGEIASSVKNTVTEAASSAVGKAKAILPESMGGTPAAVNPEADLSKITDMISPKATASEAKVAQSEGRLVKGQEPGLFRSGTEDKVMPTDEQVRTGKTIQKYIPGATNMNESELTTGLSSTNSDIARQLQPEMEKVPVTPDTIKQINDEWTTLKAKQLEDAPANLEANVAKRQGIFEKFLLKSKSENFNDLWQTRIKYDSSIPSNVKNATDAAAPDIYQQHTEWIQNRAVLNTAIKNASQGLGTEAQDAFQEMSDMHNAQEALLSKAKIETKVKPSKVKQFAKEHPYITATGAGIAAHATGLDKAALGAIMH